MIRNALRAMRSEVWAWRVSRSGRSRLARLRARPLRVHLGCGKDIRPGWINVDLQRGVRTQNYVNYDLRRGLPLPAASCSIIYSSHFIEHLSLTEARKHFADCYAALEPGGTLRMALPHFEELVRRYVAGDAAYFEPLAEYCGPQNTLAGYMDYVMHQYGQHHSFQDINGFRDELGKAGFSEVTDAPFDPDIDSNDPMRMRYSLYVSARK